MQGESAVRWDPIYEGGPPSLIVRLYLLYLLAVLLVFLVRSVKLAWCLGWFSLYRKDMLDEIGRQIHKTDLGSASAMAGRLPLRIPERGLRDWTPLPEPNETTAVLKVLHRAGNTFVFVWEGCAVAARSMQRSSVLTAILSFLVLASNGIQILQRIQANSIGPAALAGAAAESLVVFAVGLLVCAVLYAGFDLFERALWHRKARWDYFCACAKDDLSK